MYTFQGGRKFYSGNKCERVFNNKGNTTEKGENIYVYKDQRIFRPSAVIPKAGARKIGIPRILNMYEDYPFWNTLLTYAGFEVVLSAESNFHRYESALGSVMSDNICFPAKLVHSHIAELDKMGLERILMPYVVYEHKEDSRTINSYNCPIVSAYSDVIKSAMEPKTPIDAPVINFSNIKLLRKQINDYLHGLGVSKSLIKKAFEAALDAQEAYTQDIQAKAEEILAKSRREGKLTILLAGRPYHTDPIVQHKLSDMVASLGVKRNQR
jgi:predicted nucleotide-binding protein (sugar kinase/HSP70/actin superfamily)